MTRGITIIIITIILTTAKLALAIDSTSSASPSAQTQSKLEALKAEIASKAAKLKAEISQKLQNRAYAGPVKNKSDQTITIATKTGIRIINITEDSVFESKIKTKSKFSRSTLKEEDYIAALGDIDENAVLTAKKLVLLSSDYRYKKFIRGKITSKDSKKIMVKGKEGEQIVLISQDTKFRKKAAKVTAKSLQTGDSVFVTGFYNQGGELEASLIYVKSALSGETIPEAGEATASSKQR